VLPASDFGCIEDWGFRGLTRHDDHGTNRIRVPNFILLEKSTEGITPRLGEVGKKQEEETPSD